ncbi:MAG: SoxR reducing system RseC family protein [Bacteroidales bacterium]|nr:SoxR reducing system RseC family protein [Bacteroidales bacterium]
MEHKGTVVSVADNSITVRIVSPSACGGCAAQSYCVPSANRDRDRDMVIENFSGEFVAGEPVTVTMRQFAGFRALMLGYVLPCVLTLVTLTAMLGFTGNEAVSGLSALLVLLPYYATLGLMNRKIGKTFALSVKKINS